LEQSDLRRTDVITTSADIAPLLDRTGDPVVSLLLPTHRVTAEARQDELRLKNLLDDAERRLRALGVVDPRRLLRPGWELLEEGTFWRHLDHGLALYLAVEWAERILTPFPLPELAAVGRRPHVRPLLAGIAPSRRFYLLTLSRQTVKLFAGTRFRLDPIELDGVPAGIGDVLRFVVAENQVQARVAARRGGDVHQVVHGHGGAEELADERVLEYFRQVDAVVRRRLDGEAPLVLAGVEELLPLYRRVTSYAKVLEEGLLGNRDDTPPQTLHGEAWALVEPGARARLEDDLGRYAEQAAKGRAVDGVEPVLMAALQGRVQTLFVDERAACYGIFSRESGEVRVHEPQEAGDEDLLELATAMALGAAGRVWALAREKLPAVAPVAAATRF
jgi:hypothetical protein